MLKCRSVLGRGVPNHSARCNRGRSCSQPLLPGSLPDLQWMAKQHSFICKCRASTALVGAKCHWGRLQPCACCWVIVVPTFQPSSRPGSCVCRELPGAGCHRPPGGPGQLPAEKNVLSAQCLQEATRWQLQGGCLLVCTSLSALLTQLDYVVHDLMMKCNVMVGRHHGMKGRPDAVAAAYCRYS